jgi:hypothetical protein
MTIKIMPIAKTQYEGGTILRASKIPNAYKSIPDAKYVILLAVDFGELLKFTNSESPIIKNPRKTPANARGPIKTEPITIPA